MTHINRKIIITIDGEKGQSGKTLVEITENGKPKTRFEWTEATYTSMILMEIATDILGACHEDMMKHWMKYNHVPDAGDKVEEEHIADKQVEELRGQGSGPDYNTAEGRFRNAHKFQQEQQGGLKVLKYIDSEKLKAEIERQQRRLMVLSLKGQVDMRRDCAIQNGAYDHILGVITSLQQEQPGNMIQWTGNNLKEVIDFTGKSPRFGEWFNSWKEYENYVHTHNDILKLFCEDGSHFEVPVGAWIVKTPDGYNVPSVARFIHAKQEQPEVDLEKEFNNFLDNVEGIPRMWHSDEQIELAKDIAKHFYELGRNARKEE